MTGPDPQAAPPTSGEVPPPTGPCPKCGRADAFKTGNPKWEAKAHVGAPAGEEVLCWYCSRCGYEVMTPVKS